jgi:flagellar protein FliO/FliZ
MDEVFLALRVVVSLAIVLGTIYYAYRRITKGHTQAKKLNPINVISRQGVAGKAAVILIESEGHRFLLGVTEQSVNVLHSSVAPTIETPADIFARLLADSDAASATSFTSPAATAQPAPMTQPASEHAHSVLAGSILSPRTWTQAYAAMRQGPTK